jgi:hypothetical protein
MLAVQRLVVPLHLRLGTVELQVALTSMDRQSPRSLMGRPDGARAEEDGLSETGVGQR